jgi:hypothetical protein
MQFTVAVRKSIDWILRNFIVARLFMKYLVITAPQHRAPGLIPSQLCATTSSHMIFLRPLLFTFSARNSRLASPQYSISARQLPQNVPADAGFLCDNAFVPGDKIKVTLCISLSHLTCSDNNLAHFYVSLTVHLSIYNLSQ